MPWWRAKSGACWNSISWRQATRGEAGAQYAVVSLAQYALWVIGLLVALKILNINLTAIAVVAGALGIGLGFGLQNVVANFVCGLVLLVERPIRVRDRITMEGVEPDKLCP